MTPMVLPTLFQAGGAYGSLADPPGSSVLLAAVSWLEGTLLGTVATVAAIVATAAFGFAMLSGRIDVRRGAAAVLGCFILFGAASIVAGIQASLTAAPPPAASPAPPAPPMAAAAPAPAPAPDYDPYAGASVPQR
jgi:type IV secretory pathway VirB2 component (pilin)